MQTTIIKLSEIKTNNPNLCMSALRYCGNCFKCQQFNRCESRIISEKAKDFMKKQENFNEVKEEYDQLKKELEELKEL